MLFHNLDRPKPDNCEKWCNWDKKNKSIVCSPLACSNCHTYRPTSNYDNLGSMSNTGHGVMYEYVMPRRTRIR